MPHVEVELLPRIKSVPDQRIYKVDREANCGHSEQVFSGLAETHPVHQ